MMIQINLAEDAVAQTLHAVSPYVAESQVKVFEEKEPPKLESEDEKEFEELAQKVAKLVRPTARQPMRAEALKAALTGWDTYWDQQAEPDPSLRNALGALSKAIRPAFPYDSSPIDRIATRTKQFFDNGTYQGTIYTPTKLGVRVREILQAENGL